MDALPALATAIARRTVRSCRRLRVASARAAPVSKGQPKRRHRQLQLWILGSSLGMAEGRTAATRKAIRHSSFLRRAIAQEGCALVAGRPPAHSLTGEFSEHVLRQFERRSAQAVPNRVATRILPVVRSILQLPKEHREFVKPVQGLVLVQCAMPILILFAPEALIAAILIAIGTIRGENGSF